MGKLFTLLLLFVFIPSFGQTRAIEAITDDHYNFTVINGNVAWQYVYTTNKSTNEIRRHFEKLRTFDIVGSDSMNIHGKANNQPVDYAKYGFSTGGVPMYIISAPCSYHIDIAIKDGRYKVTIYNIVFNPAIRTSMMINGNAQMTLNELTYNYRRNKFKSSFFSMNGAAVLSTVWYNTYLFKELVAHSDDW